MFKMSDPITHAATASPWIVAMLTSLASLLFDLPLGVVITAAGGSYWAVYRNPQLKFVQSLFLISAGMAIASVMVEGVSWFFKYVLAVSEIPQRPLAFILGFAIIDKDFPDRIINYITAKLDGLEVKK